MAYENLKKLTFLIVQSVLVVVSASYYQKEISGYLFTTFSYYSSELRNQYDAQNGCIQNGSKLLAIANASIQNAVVAFINDAIKQNQLSGNNIITDGKRTNDNWRWINGSSPYPIPLSIGGDYSFGYLNKISTGFTLWAAQPTDTNYYICEFAGQTVCVNGYQYGGQCFQSFNEDVTWFEARNRCLLRGGDLATFEFITTNDGLNTLNGSWINSSTNYWIGLRRQLWSWQSMYSDVTYSQWAEKEPVYYTTDYYDCVCLGPYWNDWKWTACTCAERAQFVCIRTSSPSGSVTTIGTSHVTTATTSLISSSTLNNRMPQSSSSANAIQNETIAQSSISEKDKLAIGLGVGLGGGVLLLIILIIVLILLSRKGYISCPRKSTTPKDTTTSSPPPDLISSQPPPPNGIYAPICPSNESFQDDIDTNPQSAEYAPLQIVGFSSNRGTLAPPSVSGPSNTEL